MKIDGKIVRGVHLFRKRVGSKQHSDLAPHRLVFCDDHDLRYAFGSRCARMKIRRMDELVPQHGARVYVGELGSWKYFTEWNYNHCGTVGSAMRADGWTQISWESAPTWVHKTVRMRLSGYKPPANSGTSPGF